MSWRLLAIVTPAALMLGTALPFGWLVWQQAEPPVSTWVATDGPLLPPEEDPWRLIEGRGEVTLRTAPGRILLPLELMPELKELFHGLDQNDQAGLGHASVAVRAYAAAHLMQDEPRSLARLKALLADDAPVRVSAEVNGETREVELRALVVEMLCALAQGDEPGVASGEARRLLLRVRREPKLLAVRDAVRACLGEDAGGASGVRLAFGDWAAGAVTGVRRWWSPSLP
jgi:hypothetical protein